MDIRETLLKKYGGADPSSEGLTIIVDTLIDYCLLVYGNPEGEFKQLHERKDDALKQLGISKKNDHDILIFNRSIIVSKIVTDILHIKCNREFELYVSALEAATILLEVVRRPIDDNLDDEKWAITLKAKKQGFMDAKEMIDNAREIAEKITGVKEVDVEKHVDESVFKGGVMERLAKERK